jgi:hypothetical protein
MMILMAHHQHGHMHVYTEADAVMNEKNGWIREDISSKEQTEIVKQTETMVKRGPGRPKKE